jgi:hypothetical protein
MQANREKAALNPSVEDVLGMDAGKADGLKYIQKSAFSVMLRSILQKIC